MFAGPPRSERPGGKNLAEDVDLHIALDRVHKGLFEIGKARDSLLELSESNEGIVTSSPVISVETPHRIARCIDGYRRGKRDQRSVAPSPYFDVEKRVHRDSTRFLPGSA